MSDLESQWITYRNACYPPSKIKLNALQESETRQAFFAGCLVVLAFAVESSAKLEPEAAYQNICNLINEAQTVCRQRIYEIKGRN